MIDDIPNSNMLKLYIASEKAVKIMYLIDHEEMSISKKLTAYIDFNLNSQNYQKIIGNILEHLIPSNMIGIKLWIVFTDEITLHAIVKIQNKSKVKKK